MEAARMNDEASVNPPAEEIPPPSTEGGESARAGGAQPPASGVLPPLEVRIEEILLSSGAGEVLFQSQCQSPNDRLRLLAQLEEMGGQLSTIAPVGAFERLEIRSAGKRAVCLVRPDRRLFVRSVTSGGEPA
jgi:hypothetical protein